LLAPYSFSRGNGRSVLQSGSNCSCSVPSCEDHCRSTSLLPRMWSEQYDVGHSILPKMQRFLQPMQKPPGWEAPAGLMQPSSMHTSAKAATNDLNFFLQSIFVLNHFLPMTSLPMTLVSCWALDRPSLFTTPTLSSLDPDGRHAVRPIAGLLSKHYDTVLPLGSRWTRLSPPLSAALACCGASHWGNGYKGVFWCLAVNGVRAAGACQPYRTAQKKWQNYSPQDSTNFVSRGEILWCRSPSSSSRAKISRFLPSAECLFKKAALARNRPKIASNASFPVCCAYRFACGVYYAMG
jgi:hypothetical protein